MVSANVVDRFIVHDQQSREVQLIELSERYQRVVWIHASSRVIHGGEELAKRCLPLRIDRRQNHETCLRSHDLSTQRPRRPSVRNAARHSSCAAASKASHTSAAERGSDFPGGDARRYNAMDYKRAVWQSSSAPES